MRARKVSRRRFLDRLEYVACRHCGREFRSIRWSHLVSVHRYDPEHPVEEYKTRFALARATSGHTMRKMKASLVAHFQRLGRHWTKARVKKEIRRFKQEGRAIDWPTVWKRFRNVFWAAARLFGSWQKAVAAAGFHYDAIRVHRAWTPAGILREIALLHRQGQALSAGAMRQRDYGLLQAAVTRWGSWAKALQVAGLDARKARTRRRWKRESILESIRALGGAVPAKEMRVKDSGLLWAARREFGTWRAAVETAGFTYPSMRKRWKWPRPRVLEEIGRRARRGLPVRATEVMRGSKGLYEAGSKEFGTWRDAVAAAGVPYPERRGGWKWPHEKILREIRTRARQGRSVRDSVLKREQGGLWWAGRREFGSWPAAVKAAGVKYPLGGTS